MIVWTKEKKKIAVGSQVRFQSGRFLRSKIRVEYFSTFEGENVAHLIVRMLDSNRTFPAIAWVKDLEPVD